MNRRNFALRITTALGIAPLFERWFKEDKPIEYSSNFKGVYHNVGNIKEMQKMIANMSEYEIHPTAIIMSPALAEQYEELLYGSRGYTWTNADRQKRFIELRREAAHRKETEQMNSLLATPLFTTGYIDAPYKVNKRLFDV